VGCHRPITLVRDAFNRVGNRFKCAGHMEGIRVNERVLIHGQCNVTFPEKQIALLGGRAVWQRFTQLGFLLVAVAGAWDSAGG